ncbi:MAG TPA: arylamine N-acetyltransferase [Acidimicrobiales bacterium]
MRPLDDDQLAAYLARVGVERRAATLTALHLAHRHAVPFENLDIHLGEPVSLDLDRIVDKVVRRRRGGFCYEHNLLFAAALTALGHEVGLLSASMWNPTAGRWNPPFDHLALEVDDGGRAVLADVGSGRGFLVPLPFDGGGWVEHPAGGAHRLVPEPGGDGWVVQQRAARGEPVEPGFRFERAHHEPGDFAAMCHHQQTSPESVFTTGWVCTMARPGGGRLTVRNGLLVEEWPGHREERPLAGPDELERVLVERFGMAPVAVPAAWFAAGPG